MSVISIFSRITFSLAILLCLLFVSFSNAAPLKIQIGQPFPDLLLPSLEDGSPMSLTDYRGEKVMLHIFASW